MTHNRRNWRSPVVAATVLSALAISTLGRAQTSIRPISDFLKAQGKCSPSTIPACPVFVPPVANFVGWFTQFSLTAPNRCASVDYAGLANAWLKSQGHPSLGTETQGTIIERTLLDGKAEVTVLLHTTK